MQQAQLAQNQPIAGNGKTLSDASAPDAAIGDQGQTQVAENPDDAQVIGDVAQGKQPITPVPANKTQPKPTSKVNAPAKPSNPEDDLATQLVTDARYGVLGNRYDNIGNVRRGGGYTYGQGLLQTQRYVPIPANSSADGFYAPVAPDLGVRMNIIDFLHKTGYLKKGDKLTIENVAQFWNPKSDGNRTEDWIGKIVQRSGISRDTEIDPNNEEMLINLAHGLNYAEFTDERGGLPTVSEPDFVRGVRMAMGQEVPPKPLYQYRGEIINNAIQGLDHLKMPEDQRQRVKQLIYQKFNKMFQQEDLDTSQTNLANTPPSPDDDRFGEVRY